MKNFWQYVPNVTVGELLIVILAMATFPVLGQSDEQIINAPATGDELHALVITVCVKGECDKYAVDKNFTLADCKAEAKKRHLNDAPVVSWECIILDTE